MKGILGDTCNHKVTHGELVDTNRHFHGQGVSFQKKSGKFCRVILYGRFTWISVSSVALFLFLTGIFKRCRQTAQVISGPKPESVIFCNLPPSFYRGLHSLSTLVLNDFFGHPQSARSCSFDKIRKRIELCGVTPQSVFILKHLKQGIFWEIVYCDMKVKAAL